MATRIMLVILLLCWAAESPAQEEEGVPVVVDVAATSDEAADAPADPLDAQAMQYEQMLRPKMWRELEFIKQHCDLTREQRPKIKAAADAGVKKAAKEVVQQFQRPGNQQADPSAAIRKDLLATLEKTLSKQQMARYQEGAALRAAALKKTTIRSVVSQLDGFLYLTREQRDKITQELDANWQESWEQWFMMWQYGGMYFPMIPDQHLAPHLNDQQKSVWQGVQKISPGFWGGGGLRQQTDDAWWEGKEEAEAKPPSEIKPETKME